jgi:hypothetical protein
MGLLFTEMNKNRHKFLCIKYGYLVYAKDKKEICLDVNFLVSAAAL